MFQDRADAGVQLGRKLLKYRDRHPLVLAIPRGGVEVGAEIARALLCPLSIVIVRKLPFPDNPEAGFGAIAEDGSTYRVPRYRDTLPSAIVRQIEQVQQEEIARRIEVLRDGRPLPDIEGRTVILTDDGIAMGSTMHAAVTLCRKQSAAAIVVAVPVASPQTAEEFARLTEETIVLEQPQRFFAVAQAYADWYDVTNEEVLRILEQFRHFMESTNSFDIHQP